MPHELAWARYNADVIAITCRRCGQGKNLRCIGSAAGITPAHEVRYKDAGYRWSTKDKRLYRP